MEDLKTQSKEQIIKKLIKIMNSEHKKDMENINKPIEYKVVKALIVDMDLTVRLPISDEKFISPGDIQLNKNIEECLHKFREHGYLIIAASNQAGVAHGFKTVDKIRQEFDETRSLFKDYPIDVIYYCMMDGNGSVHPYNYRSLSRKPSIGMLALAEERFREQGLIIDWDHSLFVGDSKEDKLCASNARIRFQHIEFFLKKPEKYLIKNGSKPKA